MSAESRVMHMDAALGVLLLRRALIQLRRWSERYGKHRPEWSQPSGEAELQEDIDDYLNEPRPQTDLTKNNVYGAGLNADDGAGAPLRSDDQGKAGTHTQP